MPKYINADILNAKVYELYDPSDNDDIHRGIGTVQDLINEMPAADVVEVKYGHWELQEADELWLDCEWICSECKGRNDSYNKTNFCPNCGADMRERKETK